MSFRTAFNRFSKASFSAGRQHPHHHTPHGYIREKVPIIGVTVGSIALLVQVFLLYPAHEHISDQIVDIEVSHHH